MINPLKTFLMNQRRTASEKNRENIKYLLRKYSKPECVFLDLGCDDGTWTMEMAASIPTSNIYGIEIIGSRMISAIENGVKAKKANLNEEMPYPTNSFDLVHSNKVIEHLSNTDLFVGEIFRVLKPGGFVVISSENLASWHNIFSLLFGFMPFSLVNVSNKTAALGNPFAPHYSEEFWESDSWQHLRVFTPKGLIHLCKLFGFEVIATKGAGYYPFGNWAAKLDTIHSAFLTICAKKP